MQEAPAYLQRALRNIHPRAAFVFRPVERRWRVALGRVPHPKHDDDFDFEAGFALVDGDTGKPVQPCVAVLPFARLFFDFRRDPLAHMTRRWDARKRAYERWMRRDRENTEQSTAEVVRYLKRKISRLGLPQPGVHGLDRRGLDELRQRDPQRWHESLEAQGYEEPAPMTADITEDYSDRAQTGEG